MKAASSEPICSEASLSELSKFSGIKLSKYSLASNPSFDSANSFYMLAISSLPKACSNSLVSLDPKTSLNNPPKKCPTSLTALVTGFGKYYLTSL